MKIEITPEMAKLLIDQLIFASDNGGIDEIDEEDAEMLQDFIEELKEIKL